MTMFYIVLGGGTLAMMLVMLFAGRMTKTAIWKRLVSAVILTAAGVAGAKLMFWIESGFKDFGGRSFYGALFFAPCLMIPVALLLKMKISEMLDLCAPSECVMLALLKANCYIDGCCGGKVIYQNEFENVCIIFPSQIVECVTALLLMVLLLFMIRRGNNKGTVYAQYMIIYGVLRFILNLMRETSPFIWILPAGNFWSLISLAIGLVWLYIVRKKNPIKKPRAKVHKRYSKK